MSYFGILSFIWTIDVRWTGLMNAAAVHAAPDEDERLRDVTIVAIYLPVAETH